MFSKRCKINCRLKMLFVTFYQFIPQRFLMHQRKIFSRSLRYFTGNIQARNFSQKPSVHVELVPSYKKERIDSRLCRSKTLVWFQRGSRHRLKTPAAPPIVSWTNNWDSSKWFLTLLSLQFYSSRNTNILTAASSQHILDTDRVNWINQHNVSSNKQYL